MIKDVSFIYFTSLIKLINTIKDYLKIQKKRDVKNLRNPYYQLRRLFPIEKSKCENIKHRVDLK